MSESGILQPADLTVEIEALLFVSTDPVSVGQLADSLQVSSPAIEKGLLKLGENLRTRGLRLQQHGGLFQLTTAPELAEKIERFLGLEATSHLSSAGLETLAIVAYQQPVTRPQIDSIRGVSSDGVMKSLLGKGLIQEIGRAEGPGRPILYGTAPEFLQRFGLNSIRDLPSLDLQESSRTTSIIDPTQEQ